MHQSRTSVTLIAHSSTGDVASTNGKISFVAGPGLGCTSPDIWRRGVECGPFVFVAILWSRVGSVQAL